MTKLRRVILFIGAALLLSSSLNNFLISSSSAIDKNSDSLSKAKAYLYATWLRGCWQSGQYSLDDAGDASVSNLNIGSGDAVSTGWSDADSRRCNDKAYADEAINYIGIPWSTKADAIKFVCVAIANADDRCKDPTSQASLSSTAQWGINADEAAGKRVMDMLNNHAGYDIQGAMMSQPLVQYMLNYSLGFMVACSPQELSGGATNTTSTVTLKVINPDGKSFKEVKYGYDSNGRIDYATRGADPYHPDGNGGSCGDFIKKLNSLDYSALKNTATAEASKAGGTLPGYSTQPKQDGDQSVTGKTTCAVDGVGWIICPVMKIVSQFNDKIYAWLSEHLLQVNIEAFKQDSSSGGAFIAWKVFRDYANVAFVIVFLVIIYSQITSAGISNYGIKKMLPKLLIMAVLVNISFYVCVAAVDLSNILGNSLTNLFDGIVKQIGGVDGVITPNAWQDNVGKILIGVAAIGGMIALAFMVPVAGLALLALVAIAATLLIRQALVILLVVVSPLAFVAYLLPNTSDLFTKWRKIFTTLLMLFPIIAVVYGASKLAASILGSTGDNTQKIVALGVTALPFIVVPGMLKGALAVIGSFGTKMQGISNKATGKVGAGFKSSASNSYLGRQHQIRQKARDARRSMVIGGTYSGINPVLKARSAINRRLNSSAISGGAGDRMAAIGEAQQAQLVEEDKKAFTARMAAANLTHDERFRLANGESVKGISGKSLAAKMAAQEAIVGTGDADEINRLIDHAGSISTKEREGAAQLNHLADTLQRSPNKPSYIQPGDFENMRHNGDGSTLSSSSGMIRQALRDNVYSADKQASTGRQEMGIVRKEIAKIHEENGGSITGSPHQADVQRFIGNAHTTITDTQLSRQLGKQRDMVEASARGVF